MISKFGDFLRESNEYVFHFEDSSIFQDFLFRWSKEESDEISDVLNNLYDEHLIDFSIVPDLIIKGQKRGFAKKSTRLIFQDLDKEKIELIRGEVSRVLKMCDYDSIKEYDSNTPHFSIQSHPIKIPGLIECYREYKKIDRSGLDSWFKKYMNEIYRSVGKLSSIGHMFMEEFNKWVIYYYDKGDYMELAVYDMEKDKGWANKTEIENLKKNLN